MTESETSVVDNDSVVLPPDHAAVLKHMDMYQSIITRMASNSAACKKWAIPLITLVLGFVVKEGQGSLAWVTVIPIIIFYILDSYYLMLENQFRDGFNFSAEKIGAGEFKQSDLFKFVPKGEHWKKSLQSKATWPVYLGLLFVVFLSAMLVVPVAG